jgi:transcriptional regulator with XRE-family HTH domain
MAKPAELPLHPLRQYRERHNLRLTDLAGRVGMSAAGLSRIEAGSTELPGCAAIMALAAATRYEVGELDIFRWHFHYATGRDPVGGTVGYQPGIVVGQPFKEAPKEVCGAP